METQAHPVSSTSSPLSPGTKSKYQPRPPQKPSSNLTSPSSPAAPKSHQLLSDAEETVAAPMANTVPKGTEYASTTEKGLNASPLHDVELYESLLKLLPNCPVVDSILFTHRGVLEDAETPNEQLTTLNAKLAEWKTKQKEELEKRYAQFQEEESFEASKEFAKAKIEDEKRNAKINDLSLRIEALQNAVTTDVSRIVSKQKDLTSPDGGPSENSYFRKEWELLQIRKKERDAEVKSECERLQTEDLARESYRKELDFVAERAKIGISEQLTRCGLLSDYDRNRLRISALLAESNERLTALRDANDYIQAAVIEVEAKEREKIDRLKLSLLGN